MLQTVIDSASKCHNWLKACLLVKGGHYEHQTLLNHNKAMSQTVCSLTYYTVHSTSLLYCSFLLKATSLDLTSNHLLTT